MTRNRFFAALLAAALVPTASAQRGSAPIAPPIGPSLVPATSAAPDAARTVAPPHGRSGSRPTVLLTGYWPPTNEGVRQFSPEPALNPGGWAGGDWRGRGYDVVSYFPTFNNPNCNNCGTGMGDLEVDYQDTATDFAALVDTHKPIAIITFSRGFPGNSWEVEMNQYNRRNWINDYASPFQPTPAPPDPTIDRNALRISALPVQDIVDRVAASGLPLAPAICFSGDGGAFLSEFIAYLGVAYQGNHADPSAPDWCIAAGHIHVGINVGWTTCESAVEETLEAVLDYVDDVLSCPPMQPYCPGAANSEFSEAKLTALGHPSVSANDLEIVVQRAVRSQSGILFYGPGQTSAPLGDGLLCISGPLTRMPNVETSNIRGLFRFPLDLNAAPLSNVAPGTTLNFQAWYRDPAGPSGSNTSSALSITFCP